jgi:polyhydroxyalkanoate synthesis regulator phasin
MMDTIKQTLKAGLGATVLTAEKLESSLQDLVKRGRISADEAREAARKISEQSKSEFRDRRATLEKSIDELLEKAPVVRKSEFEKAQARIAELEKRLAKLSPQSNDSESKE